MEAKRTQVTKTIEVKEDVIVLTMTREEADFLARFVGTPNAQEVLQLVRRSIRPLMSGSFTLDGVGKMTTSLYRALVEVL